MTVQERQDLGYSDGHRAIVEVIGAEGFTVPETEKQVELSVRLMSGWLDGQKVWNIKAIGWGIGEKHLVDFGLFPTQADSSKWVRLTDMVGGWSIRVASPVNPDVKYAWIVVGWHDESIVPSYEERDAYGRPVVDHVDKTDPNTGEVVATIGIPRIIYRYRRGLPYVSRRFTPVMWKRFECDDVVELEVIQQVAADLRDRMVAAWEEHSAPLDEGGDEARTEAAMEAALRQRDEEPQVSPFEELC